MKFGPIAIDEAEGAILAHSQSVGERRIRKAHVLTADDIRDLKAHDVREVVAARLEPTDVGEDEAAERLVRAMRIHGIDARNPATGRVNLHAERAGVLQVNADIVNAINAIDPAITVATLADNVAVEAGQMVATVKIIPYAVEAELLARAEIEARSGSVLTVQPFMSANVGIIQTTLPGLKAGVLDKTLKTTAARLARSGSKASGDIRVPHETLALTRAIADASKSNEMVLVFGASAVSDFDDVIPAAIRAAGGRVERVGMPVDPGQLLVLGSVGDVTIIGAPGCARSPKENGFDWVLDRILAGISVTHKDIAGMGVGGLLMEISSRPQPREATEARAVHPVRAVLLAAGRSSRMGGPNKLMAEFDGTALIRRTAERTLLSGVASTVVVTGHQAPRILDAVRGLDIQVAHNSDFQSGMASSLQAGVASLPAETAGALILLGDMPGIESADLDRMIAAFTQSGGSAVVRATHNGKRGNPVLLPRRLFGAVMGLEGDTGARRLIEDEVGDVIDVELGLSASLDVDTPEAIERAGGILRE